MPDYFGTITPLQDPFKKKNINGAPYFWAKNRI